MKGKRVAIVGAGAAGCFCAVELKRSLPEAEVVVYERGRRPLAKVAITGGGRCNLTNSFRQITDLRQAYPRGARLMQRLFHQFSPADTQDWWEREGVALVTQDDECVFPHSQDAMQVVETLLRLMRQHGVRLLTECPVSSIVPMKAHTPSEMANSGSLADEGYAIISARGTETFDYIVITTGGAPRATGLSFLSALQLDTVPPVPSLFALNLGDDDLHNLTGTVVENTPVSIVGTKLKADGALLITHFGMSGPAILRLSSYAARYLAEQDYRVTLSVNWMQGRNESQVLQELECLAAHPKLLTNLHPEHLTARHWAYLLQRAGIPDSRRWDSLNRKELNRLTSLLTSDTYQTNGRRTHKAEFVTCGGVSLQSVQPQTLALKAHPHAFLAGEVLDVDAITGGFNLQAAWSMGYVVAKSIADSR